MYQSFSFPQFPEKVIFLTYFTDVPTDVLETVKSQLIAGNKEYDFCFLNTKHIISLEHLRSGLYRAISNSKYDAMRAKTLNTEILFNLSPVNNIMDAIKRFGVDSECSDTIVIKVADKESELDLAGTEKHLESLLGSQAKSETLSDELLLKNIELSKFKKLYKLNDAVLSGDGTQEELTRLAVAACQLRGL